MTKFFPFISLVSSLAVAAGTAFGATEWPTSAEDGAWSGGFSGQGQKIVLQATIINGLGELTVNQSNWNGSGIYGDCQYQFEIDGGTVERAFLNEAVGRAAECFPDMPFSVERTGLDTLALTPHPEIAQVWGIDEFQMQGGLRPPLDEERRAPVEGLDILGLKLGMTMDEATDILQDREFTAMEEKDYQYESFIRPQRQWGRIEGENGDFLDTVIVSYSSVADWIPGDPVVTAVSREREFQPSDGMTELRIVSSFSEKYGIDAGNTSSRYYWSRDGMLQQNQNCGESPHQPVPFQYLTVVGNRSDKVQVTCGPTLYLMVRSDRSTGLADEFTTILSGVDGPWEDFWDVWSRGERDRLQAIYQSVSSAGGAGPDL